MGTGTTATLTSERLMLRELNLTYMIQDEVLLITTPEEADARLTTKVYPVADLVVQSAFGDSGHTTFFISNEDEFNKHKDEIVSKVSACFVDDGGTNYEGGIPAADHCAPGLDTVNVVRPRCAAGAPH